MAPSTTAETEAGTAADAAAANEEEEDLLLGEPAAAGISLLLLLRMPLPLALGASSRGGEAGSSPPRSAACLATSLLASS